MCPGCPDTSHSGGGGIRTLVRGKPPETVFETAASTLASELDVGLVGKGVVPRNTSPDPAMAKRNLFDGRCDVCGEPVRAQEGVVAYGNTPGKPYRILCIGHAPEGALRPPERPDVSKLPSIHVDPFDGPT